MRIFGIFCTGQIPAEPEVRYRFRVAARDIWRLARRCQLSTTQTGLLQLVVANHLEIAEAADQLGVERGAAGRAWRSMVRQLAAAAQEVTVEFVAPTPGEVFAEEATPRGNLVERHCSNGEERCAKLGYCPARRDTG